MKFEIPDHFFRSAIEKAARERVADIELVSTESAVKLLDMSRSGFLNAAKGAGLVPVQLGPRTTRWRLADVRALVEGKEDA